MSCPTIRININRAFNNGVDSDIFEYSGSLSVQVINGTSTAPLSGSLTLTHPNGNILLSLTNNNNSYTYGYFDVNGQQLYESSSAKIVLIANGNCYYEYTIDLLDSNLLNCLTTVTESQISEHCAAFFIIESLGILGCTNQGADNYNPEATIDDGSCDYTNAVYGCTNINSVNYNPEATIDDGSCVPNILGCTNPFAANYNESANVDDGSCVFVNAEIILGCTNPLSTNYNAKANFNDGSCIFLSGCTNNNADNFNPLAVIDDGSCECNKIDVVFELDGEQNFYFLNSGDVNCDYYLEFDYRIQIDCEKFLEYFDAKTDKTVLGILDLLKLYSQVQSSGGKHYRQLEYDLDVEGDNYELELLGNDCSTFKILLAEELGEKCPSDVNSLFAARWKTARLKIPASFLNKDIQLGFYLEGFAFGASILLDDIRVFSLCFQQNEECIILPYNFGFNLNQEKNNKKVSANQNEQASILNTKELSLKINVPKYITSDIVTFVNKYENLLHRVFRGMTIETLEKEFNNVTNVLTENCYHYYLHLYEQYKNGFEYCSAKSKQLDYDFLFQVFSKIDSNWLNLVQQFLPETSIWKQHNKYFSNFLLHQQKHKYKKYFIVDTTDGENIEKQCELVVLGECGETLTYTSKIDIQMLVSTGECLIKSAISPSNYSSTNYGGGRLLQYNKTNDAQIKRYDYPNQQFEFCA